MKHLLLFSLLLTSSCTTVRYRYDADVEVKKSKEYHFSLEKTYSYKLDAILCAATGIFYGGWCWTYFNKPTSEDMDLISRSADRKINNIMSSKGLNKYDYKILGSKVERVDWGWQKKKAQVSFEEN